MSEVKYKYMLFKVPTEWRLKDCMMTFSKTKDEVVIDHWIDHCIFERCTSELRDGDDFEIKELGADDWTTKAAIAAGR